MRATGLVLEPILGLLDGLLNRLRFTGRKTFEDG
jgi:hypothetical protein